MDTTARQALNALIDQLATGSAPPAMPQPRPSAPVPMPMLPVQPLREQQQDADLPVGARSAILWRSRVA